MNQVNDNTLSNNSFNQITIIRNKDNTLFFKHNSSVIETITKTSENDEIPLSFLKEFIPNEYFQKFIIKIPTFDQQDFAWSFDLPLDYNSSLSWFRILFSPIKDSNKKFFYGQMTDVTDIITQITEKKSILTLLNG